MRCPLRWLIARRRPALPRRTPAIVETQRRLGRLYLRQRAGYVPPELAGRLARHIYRETED